MNRGIPLCILVSILAQCRSRCKKNAGKIPESRILVQIAKKAGGIFDTRQKRPSRLFRQPNSVRTKPPLRPRRHTSPACHCEPVPQHWCGNPFSPSSVGAIHESPADLRPDPTDGRAMLGPTVVAIRPPVPRRGRRPRRPAPSLHSSPFTLRIPPSPCHCEPVPQHWCGNPHPPSPP